MRASLRGPLGRVGRRTREVGPGISLHDDELHVDPHVAENDPLTALRVAVAAARDDVAIERESLELLATTPTLPERWPEDARLLFIELFLAGRPAIRVVEALDQRGVWTRMLPEWLAGARQAAAQRLPPLHRRPASVGGHRERIGTHRSRASAPTCSWWARSCTTWAKERPVTTPRSV